MAARATETIANETSHCFNPHKALIQFTFCAYPCRQVARVSTKWIPGTAWRLSHRKPRLSPAARAGLRHGDAPGWKHWATHDDRTTRAAPTAFLLPAQRGEEPAPDLMRGGAQRRMRGGGSDARPVHPDARDAAASGIRADQAIRPGTATSGLAYRPAPPPRASGPLGDLRAKRKPWSRPAPPRATLPRKAARA